MIKCKCGRITRRGEPTGLLFKKSEIRPKGDKIIAQERVCMKCYDLK